ncbi:hypothetical protein AAC03nite_00780 [Alicyclobacillus acidoterrestris]|nr:hypothetical protein AAC03nite_00780 [Alicyclobacillus acidoterrestris]
MYRRVNQVVIYYDDATSTAEDKANWFLKPLSGDFFHRDFNTFSTT